jgi:hypothetical protein
MQFSEVIAVVYVIIGDSNRERFLIVNCTGHITTAQPSLNIDTPLCTGNDQIQNPK